MGALDHYDAALTVGDCFIPSIRLVEKKRSLPTKEIESAGLPYLDALNQEIPERSTKNKEIKTILVAPSWGNKNCLAVYGSAFLEELAKEGYKIIVRPHPQSLKVEQEFITQLQKKLSSYQNISFDFEIDGTQSMLAADLLISDKSSIRFDFAFLYEKPVLTLDIPMKDLSIYEASIIGSLWEEQHSEKLGMRLQPQEKTNIVHAVKQTLQMKPTDIKDFREQTIANWGHSAQFIVNWTNKKVEFLRNSK